MFEKLKQSWHQFEEGSPGKRFQQRFRRRRQSRPSAWWRALYVGTGIFVIAAGILMLVAPGPGLLAILVGAGLIAQESFLAARALDWAELRLRQLGAWGLPLWRHAPMAVKILLVLLAILITGALAFGAYMLLFAK